MTASEFLDSMVRGITQLYEEGAISKSDFAFLAQSLRDFGLVLAPAVRDERDYYHESYIPVEHDREEVMTDEPDLLRPDTSEGGTVSEQ